jgi:cell division initiation protein
MDIGSIIGKSFSKRLRGIDPDEVDFFLREVADYVGQLQKQVSQLQQGIADLETQVKKSGSVTPAAPHIQTEGEANLTLESARKKSQSLIQEAESRAAQVLEQSRTELARIKESIMIMQAKKESIGTRLKMLLQSELELIKSLEAENEIKEDLPASSVGDQTGRTTEIEEIIKYLDTAT